MAAIAEIYGAHPFWIWLALGAVLLAIEAGTGSGWLLWPAASAGVVALISLSPLRLGPIGEVAVFAGLTLVTTILARKYLVRHHDNDPDINDQSLRLIGRTGETVSAFDAGHGRAFINGAEWPAELDGGGALKIGARVEVIGVEGAKLRVKAV
jgi:membrane protein implicated in regulation of membrane protease activity